MKKRIHIKRGKRTGTGRITGADQFFSTRTAGSPDRNCLICFIKRRKYFYYTMCYRSFWGFINIRCVIFYFVDSIYSPLLSIRKRRAKII